VAATHSFDLVISDLGLPDGNGIDLMRQLRRRYGLRGIAISGYGMAADRANTKQAGFLAHLVKPINFDQLQSALQVFAPAAGANATSEASGQSSLAG
jgi:CheY-like chemotaxis protein